LRYRIAPLAAVAFLFPLSGCGVPPQAGVSDVENVVEPRIGAEVAWYADDDAKATRDLEIDALLAEPLTPSSAVRVALLAHPSVQAIYEDLAIGRADLVEAGLLPNPTLRGSVRYPDESGLTENLELGVTWPLLGILTSRSQRSVASGHFRAAQLRVAHRLIEHATRVRVAYYSFAGEQNLAELLRLTVQATEAGYQLAARLKAAGNIPELALLREQTLYEDARLEEARSRARLATAREELNLALGVGERTGWTVPVGLPPLPRADPNLDRLETTAIESRLDLAATDEQVEALRSSLGAARGWRFLPALDVGVSTERDPDGLWVAGPEASIELPLLDRGQGRLGRGESDLRRTERERDALALEIRARVRAARGSLLAAREIADHLRTVVLPLQDRVIALTQQEYNFMLAGAFELLSAKREEVDGRRQYIEAVRDYWIARAELDFLVGGVLPMPLPPPAASEPAPDPVHTHEHHHGGQGS
jgi:cobalt-zinc-cadmium efflux system outer membrane protein